MLSRFVGFFLFFLPFQFALNPSEGFDLPLARVLAVIIFLWWFARGLLRKSISLPPSLFTGAVLSFLFLSAASLLWATDTNFALRKLFFLLNFFPLIFVFYDLAEDQKVFQRWLSALVAGGTLAALISLALFGAQFIVGGEKIFFWLSQNALPFFLGENLGMAVAEYPSLLVNIGGETVLRATAFFPDPHVASFYFGITGFLALGIFLQK
ncbi:MAG: hypothetical protein ABI747_00380, partial [Candidatus Moraniibacteriota bacterium]